MTALAALAAGIAGGKKRGAAGDAGTDPATVATRMLILIENTGITGDPASAWADQSGEANDFSQSTEGNRPDVDAGKVVFDGSDDFMIQGGVATDLVSTTAYTVYTLFTLNSNAPDTTKTINTAHTLGLPANPLWGVGGMYYTGGQNYIYSQHYDSATRYTPDIAISTGTLYLARTRFDGSTLYIRCNGSEQSVSATTAHSNLSALTAALADGYGSGHQPITLQYVASYNTHLDTTTRDGIDTWFQAQYPTVTL